MEELLEHRQGLGGLRFPIGQIYRYRHLSVCLSIYLSSVCLSIYLFLVMHLSWKDIAFIQQTDMDY